VVAGGAVIGYSDPTIGIASNNVLQISSGSLFVNECVGQRRAGREPGRWQRQSDHQRWLGDDGQSDRHERRVNSVITFNGGTLTACAAFIANSQDFVIGASNVTATYVVAAGGINTFNNHLVVATRHSDA